MKRSKKENNMSVSVTRKNLLKQRALLIWAAVLWYTDLYFIIFRLADGLWLFKITSLKQVFYILNL